MPYLRLPLCAIENALVMQYRVEAWEISRSLAGVPIRIADDYATCPANRA